MPKYFLPPESFRSDRILVGGETARHLITVLRTVPGDRLILCDGAGRDYDGTVERVARSRNELEVCVTGQRPCGSEPPIRVTLYQSLLKADKLEWVLQKGVELGLSVFQPTVTAHSVSRSLDAGRLSRLSRIAQAAAEQSMRGAVPTVEPPLAFDVALARMPRDMFHAVAYEQERSKGLKQAVSVCVAHSVGLWVGPEGGYEPAEIDALTERGAVPFTLGPRILRAETAALAALTRLVAMWEE